MGQSACNFVRRRPQMNNLRGRIPSGGAIKIAAGFLWVPVLGVRFGTALFDCGQGTAASGMWRLPGKCAIEMTERGMLDERSVPRASY